MKTGRLLDCVDAMKCNAAKIREAKPSRSKNAIDHLGKRMETPVNAAPGDTAELIWGEIEIIFGL